MTLALSLTFTGLQNLLLERCLSPELQSGYSMLCLCFLKEPVMFLLLKGFFFPLKFLLAFVEMATKEELFNVCNKEQPTPWKCLQLLNFHVGFCVSFSFPLSEEILRVQIKICNCWWLSTQQFSHQSKEVDITTCFLLIKAGWGEATFGNLDDLRGLGCSRFRYLDLVCCLASS